MFHPHGLTKLFIDEQLNQLRMKSIIANKLKLSENLPDGNRRGSFFELISDIKIPPFFYRLLPVSNSSNTIEGEIRECQPSSECQAC
jgi:hypothetical protein